MAKTLPRSGRPVTRKGKVRTESWLSPKLLKESQGLHGTATERETVEAALDLMISRNSGDLAPLTKITPFEFEAPFPELP